MDASHVRVPRGRRLPAVLLSLAALGLATGCSEWGDPAGPMHGGAMTVSVPSLPSTWDPDSAGDPTSAELVRDVEAPLLQLSPNTQHPEGGIAKSWKYDASRTQLTLHLRPTAEFSNGGKVTAQDVVFSAQQWLHGPRLGKFYAQLISGATASNAHTVVLTLPKPSSDLLPALTLSSSAVVPKDFGGRTAQEFYTDPVGAGPFEIHQATASSVDLRRNRHFYDTSHPYLASLDYEVVSDPATALQDLRRGRTQLAEGVPPAALTGQRSSARVVSKPSESTSVLTFSPRQPATQVARLRHGVSLAVDRAALVSSVYAGRAAVPDGLLPPKVPADQGCAGCDWARHDVSAARSDLRDVPGHTRLTLMVDQTSPTDVRTAQALTPMLAQAGVTVHTDAVDPATMARRLASGDYQLALQTLSAQTPTAADPLETLVRTSDLDSARSATQATQALAAVSTATDLRAETSAVSVFEHQDYDSANVVPLVNPDVTDVLSPKVRGFVLQPSGLYHSSTIWLKN